MEIRTHFDHFNINVSDLERSLEFYRKALGLEKTGEIVAKDGSFIINYVSRPGETFRLELTWLKDHTQPYELGKTKAISLCVWRETTMKSANTTGRWA